MKKEATTTNETYQLARAAGLVKLICGVANNAARMVMNDGFIHARMCRRYRNDVKHAFRLASKEWATYERRLIYATENRMFHVADMTDDIRRTYGKNLTDREYYDFWASVGGPAYDKTKPMINSLWNKHRLSLQSHGVEDAEHVAWVLTAMAAIELAVQLHGKAISECYKGFRISYPVLTEIFGQFSLKGVRERWRRALTMLSPDSEFKLDPTEKRNIEMGLTQLCEAWLDPALLYDSTMVSVEDYSEVFRTKGFQQKVLRQIAEVRDETMDVLENE